ncbi:MAG: hypothetical protein D6791_07930 [Chloroflexi bacterium]|nr:MAG: hypothetical protein D6791_07930 [Chloroflexota bacterium]
MQTAKRRLWPVILLLLLIAVSLAGCGGQSAGDRLQDIAGSAIGVVAQHMPRINLPRIAMTYDESGVPTVFGMKVSSLARFLPVDVSFVELPPETIQWLVEHNVQHIELESSDAGLFIYVNGKALPYLAWNQDSLAYIGDLLDKLDVVQYDTTIAKAMPLLGRVGIDVLAKFPTQPGASEIPPRDRSQRAVAEAPAIEEPTAVINGVITYSDEGVPSIADITSREIAQLAQIDLTAVELTPEIVTLIKKAGIQEIDIVTQSDGLHLGVNKREVLRVAYNEQHLLNAIDLYTQLYTDERSEFFATFLRNIEPIFYGADIDLVIQFSSGS